ncbi:MAG: hypothetical protein ABJG41_16035 [Cyclobacteriaceae bacterium]
MKFKSVISFLALMPFLTSCGDNLPGFPDMEIQGMRPVYVANEVAPIEKLESQSFIRPGKIYVYGKLLLVSEIDAGIHVFDNTDSSNPQNLYFINVPGNTDMVIKDDHIYANSNGDLVVIKLLEDGVQLTTKQEGFFLEDLEGERPPFHDVYFECVDPEKGRVVGWETTMLDSPDCYR